MVIKSVCLSYYRYFVSLNQCEHLLKSVCFYAVCCCLMIAYTHAHTHMLFSENIFLFFRVNKLNFYFYLTFTIHFTLTVRNFDRNRTNKINLIPVCCFDYSSLLCTMMLMASLLVLAYTLVQHIISNQ